MHSRTGVVTIIGSLAISSALLLGGCGGSSTAGATSAAASSAAVAAAASAGATSAGTVTATDWNPPRPTGIPDANWADYGKDPATLTPERLACNDNKPVTPEQVDSLVAMYVGSTAEEWTAYADYYLAFVTQLCVNAPEPAAVVYEAAGACDPEAYAYCITPDMDGQTIEIQNPNQAFIDIAGVDAECEGTGYAQTFAVAGPDDDFSFLAIGTMGNPGVAGDTVCTVTGNADGATVITLNVRVLDPA